ncbi:hypothetical protein [Jeotgalibacillus terrae]|uniref:Uncharacterized protein n=1 Tax=Jeotgalibacillus terrae TaxID=587735 RepID=A0ABW5ZIA7_9BACL|nr:hypothetical protein [Jeotgalibacillus terrae]MBM7578637.1 thiosulfate reductase cytochrome b subunit [Jeotgalibacillus terrae]
MINGSKTLLYAGLVLTILPLLLIVTGGIAAIAGSEGIAYSLVLGCIILVLIGVLMLIGSVIGSIAQRF